MGLLQPARLRPEGESRLFCMGAVNPIPIKDTGRRSGQLLSFVPRDIVNQCSRGVAFPADFPLSSGLRRSRVAACRQGTDFSLKKPLLVFSASKMSTLKFLITIPGRWTICFSFVKLMHTQIQQGGCSYFGLSKNDLVSQ